MHFVSILQHCTLDFGSYTKDLTIVNEDLSSVFILDNSPGAYQYNPGKAVGTYSIINRVTPFSSGVGLHRGPES